eukprot:8147658-Pyramimonas_sp.AAC.1
MSAPSRLASMIPEVVPHGRGRPPSGPGLCAPSSTNTNHLCSSTSGMSPHARHSRTAGRHARRSITVALPGRRITAVKWPTLAASSDLRRGGSRLT